MEEKKIFEYRKGSLEILLTEDEFSYYLDDPPPGYAPISGEIYMTEEILRGMYEGLKEYYDDKHFGDR